MRVRLDMNCTIKEIDWESFKEITSDESFENAIYRGQSNSSWSLVSTLGRFLSRDRVRMDRYIEVIRNIPPNVINTTDIPASTTDINDLIVTFSTLATLRHLGFPSPILDWSENKNIAAFFAFAETIKKACAIYVLKKSSARVSHDLSFPQIEIVTQNQINEQVNSSNMKNLHPRHINQFANYSWCIYYDNSPQRDFYLSAIDDVGDNDQFQLIKYIITDSRMNRLIILQELINQGITYERLFGDTHIFENSLLKDIAIRELLIN